MNNGEKMLIMRNARRLIEGKIRQPPNYELYHKLFSAGINIARKRCIEMRLDPDSNYTGQICKTCGGNGLDAPCAYPSENKPGCLQQVIN